MKETFAKNKNLIITAALIAVVVVAGYFYANRDTSSDALLTSQSAATSTIDGDLLPVLLQLRKLKLDVSVFSSQTWLSLTDYSRPIPAQEPGRQNPFAPLDSGLTPFSSSTASAR